MRAKLFSFLLLGSTLLGCTPERVTDLAFPTPLSSLDLTAPQILQAVPGHGATQVDIRSSVQLRLSEPLQPDCIRVEHVRLYRHDSARPVPGQLHYDPEQLTLTFTPAVQLQPGTDYRLFLGQALVDQAGNSIISGFWSFTTADGTLLATQPEQHPAPTNDLADQYWPHDQDLRPLPAMPVQLRPVRDDSPQGQLWFSPGNKPNPLPALGTGQANT